LIRNESAKHALVRSLATERVYTVSRSLVFQVPTFNFIMNFLKKCIDMNKNIQFETNKYVGPPVLIVEPKCTLGASHAGESR